MANGGKREGSGRKPVEKRLTNYAKAIRLLDDNIESALQVVIDGLKDENKQYRLKCAEILLKKSLPDKKEIAGADGSPILVEVVLKDAEPESGDILPQDTKTSVSIPGAV
jgi:hypothetical protein